MVVETMRMKREKRTGQVLVELALVMPVVVLLIAGAVDFGRFVISHAEAAALCQDAARFGCQVDPATGAPRTLAEIQQRVYDTLPSGVTTDSVTQLNITTSALVSGFQAIRVDLSYELPCLTAVAEQFFTGGKMPVHASGTFLRNRNVVNN